MLKLIIALIICFNIITAWAVWVFKGKFKVHTWTNYDAPPSAKKVILLSGFRNQPDVAFSLINFSNCRQVIYLCYSNFGLNMRQATYQLQELYEKNKYADVFAISLGAKIAQSAGIKRSTLIDPCICPDAICEPYRQMFKKKAIIYGVLKVILGWLAFIPVIPVEKPTEHGIAMGPVRYSLALLADQMCCIGYGEPKIKGSYKTTLVLSKYDGLLDNEYIMKAFREAYIIMIPAGHADTLANPEPYKKALESLLE